MVDVVNAGIFNAIPNIGNRFAITQVQYNAGIANNLDTAARRQVWSRIFTGYVHPGNRSPALANRATYAAVIASLIGLNATHVVVNRNITIFNEILTVLGVNTGPALPIMTAIVNTMATAATAHRTLVHAQEEKDVLGDLDNVLGNLNGIGNSDELKSFLITSASPVIDYCNILSNNVTNLNQFKTHSKGMQDSGNPIVKKSYKMMHAAMAYAEGYSHEENKIMTEYVGPLSEMKEPLAPQGGWSSMARMMGFRTQQKNPDRLNAVTKLLGELQACQYNVPQISAAVKILWRISVKERAAINLRPARN